MSSLVVTDIPGCDMADLADLLLAHSSPPAPDDCGPGEIADVNTHARLRLIVACSTLTYPLRLLDPPPCDHRDMVAWMANAHATRLQ